MEIQNTQSASPRRPSDSETSSDSRAPAAEWRLLSSLKPWIRNPRRHADAAVLEAVASLRRFGFCAPVVAWGSREMIVAGHLRLKALERILAEDPALDGKGGADPDLAERNRRLKTSLSGPDPRHAPVRVREFDSIEEAEAYALRDNNDIGAWEDDGLRSVLESLKGAGTPIEGLGWSGDELDELLSASGPLVAAEGTDDVPDARPDAVSIRGEIYQLGPHLLACGDCRDAGVWEALLQSSEKIQMVWTDPPYGISYVGGTKEALTIENDDLDDEGLAQLLRDSLGFVASQCTKGAAWYVASPSGPQMGVFCDVLRELELWRQLLIWEKDAFAFGRSDYHYQHESIFYGWVPGAAHYFVDERTHASVLRFDRPRKNTEHPTMKPLDLVRYCIRNSSKPGWVVADPFGGSGSTLIASAAEGRIARTVELDPRYCDVIRRRWTTFAKSAGIEPGSGALD